MIPDSQPLVSVIIPTYNRETLVVRAIESVLQQTFQDFEVIVVDDGSTDGTAVRVRPYMSRIRYHFQSNMGATKAQNAGLRLARGKWIAILASDDVWYATKLERQLTALDTLGGDYECCFANCSIACNGNVTHNAFQIAGIEMQGDYGELRHPIRYLCAGRFALYVQSLLVSRSLVERIGGFDESLTIGEDVDFIARLSYRTKFLGLMEPLVEIERSPEIPRLTSMFTSRNLVRYENNERIFTSIFAAKDRLDVETIRWIRRELCLTFYSSLAISIRQARFVYAWQTFKKLVGIGEKPRDIVGKMAARLISKAASKLQVRARVSGFSRDA